jgi:hypothetical protein
MQLRCISDCAVEAGRARLTILERHWGWLRLEGILEDRKILLCRMMDICLGI